MNKLTLRDLRDKDIPQLTAWLNQEYILKWFHDPADWLLEVKERQGKFSWIHHFMVMKDDKAIGFCQYYDCYDANELEDWFAITQPNQTFSIDYLIGEESYLGEGLGKEIIRLLTELIQRKEHSQCIIVQPDQENQASNHVLLANNYVYDENKQYYIKDLSLNS